LNIKFKAKKTARRPSFYTERSKSIWRTLPIARAGFNPLGQTLTQFMMPRQRNSEKGSVIAFKRSSVAVPRLSAQQRSDCNKAAGPRHARGVHQKAGQLGEQAADHT